MYLVYVYVYNSLFELSSMIELILFIMLEQIFMNQIQLNFDWMVF